MDEILKHHLSQYPEGVAALDLNRALQARLAEASSSQFYEQLALSSASSRLSRLLWPVVPCEATAELGRLESARRRGERALVDSVRRLCKRTAKLTRRPEDKARLVKAQLAITNLAVEAGSFHTLLTGLQAQFEAFQREHLKKEKENKKREKKEKGEDDMMEVPQGTYDRTKILLLSSLEKYLLVEKPELPYYVQYVLGRLTGDSGRQSRLAPMEDYTFSSKVIGVGGQGKVHLARGESDDRALRSPWYALKVEMITAANHESVAREVWAVTSEWLRHENLLTALKCSIFSALDFSYYAVALKFEHLPDGSLAEYVLCQCLAEPEIACLMKQALSGLRHLHEQGIIHNDVKSGNLLLSGGVLKIADFGKSMFLADFTSSMMGTLNYTAPEVARAYLQGQKSGPFVTYGIDIWALGGTLYELLELQHPFHDFKNDKIVLDVISSCNSSQGLTLSKRDQWSSSMLQFFDQCTNVDYAQRPLAAKLLEEPLMTSACTTEQLAAVIKEAKAAKRRAYEQAMDPFHDF